MSILSDAWFWTAIFATGIVMMAILLSGKAKKTQNGTQPTPYQQSDKTAVIGGILALAVVGLGGWWLYNNPLSPAYSVVIAILVIATSYLYFAKAERMKWVKVYTGMAAIALGIWWVPNRLVPAIRSQNTTDITEVPLGVFVKYPVASAVASIILFLVLVALVAGAMSGKSSFRPSWRGTYRFATGALRLAFCGFLILGLIWAIPYGCAKAKAEKIRAEADVAVQLAKAHGEMTTDPYESGLTIRGERVREKWIYVSENRASGKSEQWNAKLVRVNNVFNAVMSRPLDTVKIHMSFETPDNMEDLNDMLDKNNGYIPARWRYLNAPDYYPVKQGVAYFDPSGFSQADPTVHRGFIPLPDKKLDFELSKIPE